MKKTIIVALLATLSACSHKEELTGGRMVRNPNWETEDWHNPFSVDSIYFGGEKTLLFGTTAQGGPQELWANLFGASGRITLPDGQTLKATGARVRSAKLTNLDHTFVMEFPHISASTQKIELECNGAIFYGLRLQEDNQTVLPLPDSLRERCCNYTTTEDLPKLEWTSTGEVTIRGKIHGMFNAFRNSGVTIRIPNILFGTMDIYHAPLDADSCFSIKVPVCQTIGMGSIRVEHDAERPFAYEAGKEVVIYSDNVRSAHFQTMHGKHKMELNRFVFAEGALQDINNVLLDNRFRRLWKNMKFDYATNEVDTAIRWLTEDIETFDKNVEGVPNISPRAVRFVKQIGRVQTVQHLMNFRFYSAYYIYRRKNGRKDFDETYKNIKPCDEQTAKAFFSQINLNGDETTMVSHYSYDLFNLLISFARHNDDNGRLEVFKQMMREGLVPDTLVEDTRRLIESSSLHRPITLEAPIDNEFQKRFDERNVNRARAMIGDTWPMFETIRSLTDVSGYVARLIDVPDSLMVKVGEREGEVFRKILERINEEKQSASSRIDVLEYDASADLIEQLQKRFPGKHLVLCLDFDCTEFDPCDFWNARFLDFAERDDTEFIFAATTELSDARWTQWANALGHHHIRLPRKDMLGFINKYQDDQTSIRYYQYFVLINGKSSHRRSYDLWDARKMYYMLKIMTQ